MAATPIPWTDVVVAVSTAATAVILAIAALYARSQVREARRLREAQVRPFVVLAFEIDDYPLVTLRISNVGPVLARNVRMTFDPALQTSDAIHKTPLGELPMFTEGIPSLAPGVGIPVLFDAQHHRE